MKRITLALAALALVGGAGTVWLFAQAQSSDDVIVVAPPSEPELEEAGHSLPGMIYGPQRADGSRDISYRASAVGQRVVVEGIAWGQQPTDLKEEAAAVSPWVGAQVIHQGGSVFVRGIDTKKATRGKPIRVMGTLRLQPELVTRSPPTAGLKAYYYIEATTVEPLDAVTDPYLVLVKK